MTDTIAVRKTNSVTYISLDDISLDKVGIIFCSSSTIKNISQSMAQWGPYGYAINLYICFTIQCEVSIFGPFLWMGFNCLKARATSRRQFTFYH